MGKLESSLESPMDLDSPPNLVQVESCLWICEEQLGIPGYDYRFQDFFHCRHPAFLDQEVTALARMGAAPDYAFRYERLLEWKVRLVHSPAEYNLTSNLPNWYPLIKDLTPKSIWYEELPTVAEIESEFTWPVFLKGERQTSKHNRTLSIIEDVVQFREVMEYWKRDPILHWQKVVCRQYIPLRTVAPDNGQALPKAFEFRTFWWKDRCVGLGPYWNSETYRPNPEEEAEILRIGQKVSALMRVTFLVIDIAQAQNGEWIVIECNDGQDSGYAGISPFRLWQEIVSTIQGYSYGNAPQ